MTSTIETDSDATNAAVEVRLAIDEDHSGSLEAITVTGTRRRGLASSRMRWAFDRHAGGHGRVWRAERLFRTGLFQRVDVEPTPVDEAATPGITPVRALVTLVRRAPYRLRYGVDVTDEAAPLA
jgi:hypothetical protein